MERVLYNPILGAWPIQADGTSFYYSDYATVGKKAWYRDKWPCCSGTFPQLAADYHISAYLRSVDGVYVNLFTPSTVRWSADGAKLGLTLHTKYPFENTVRIEVAASCPTDYALYVRIPGWAGSDPILSVNGKRVSADVHPGTFAAIKRTWSEGDHVDLDLPMPLRLEKVDGNHPNLVALMRGPLVLFAVADSQPSFDRAELLRAQLTSNSAGDSLATSSAAQQISILPFIPTKNENSTP